MNIQFEERQILTDILKGDGNRLFSLYSLESVLNMLYMFSGGRTQGEVLDILGTYINPKKDLNALQSYVGGYDGNFLESFNHVFHDRSIAIKDRKDFEKCGIEFNEYDCSDTASIEKIANLISDETNGLINDVKPTQDTCLMIANVLYFKSLWSDMCKVKKNGKKEFTCLDSTKHEVRYIKGECYGADEEEDYISFSLNYELPGVYFTCIIPTDMDKFLTDIKMDEDKLVDCIENSIYSKLADKVYFEMPEIKLNRKINLDDSLRKVGFETAYTFDANLRKLTSSKCHIDAVEQSITVDINDKGTEAAAVTSMYMKSCSIRLEEPREIIVDKAYLFFISAEDKLLFCGKVTDIEGMKP